MKLRRWLMWVLILGLVSALPAAGLAKETITVTDMAKRAVQVPRKPDRIVCVAPGTLRLICYLDVQDKLVGVEQFEKTRPVGRPYWIANPDLAKLPSIGPGGPKSINSEPDLEAILKVQPDVIFISYMKPAKADELQQKLGIPVVVLTYGRFATFDPVVYDSISLVGKIMGREARAKAIATFIKEAQDDLLGRVAQAAATDKPSVYVGGIGYKGYQGIESTDASYVPLEWVHANNVTKDVQEKGHLFVDKEQVLSWNPQIVFLDAGGMKLVKEDYRKKPAFYHGLQAFKNGTVYLLLPFNWYMTNIGTAIADGYACGKILYPGQFRDIDLPAKADEVYEFLVGKRVYTRMEEDFGELGGTVNLQD